MSSDSSNASLAETYGSRSDMWSIIVAPTSSLMVMIFLYGFYVLLFGLCLRALFRSTIATKRFYIILATLLFLMATVICICETWLLVRQAIRLFTPLKTGDWQNMVNYLYSDSGKTALETTLEVTSILMNVVVDVMLIHRIYTIWGCRKRVAIPLAFISFGIAVVGLAGSTMLGIGETDLHIPSNRESYFTGNNIYTGFSIAGAVFNAILTLLAAGRIFWISREASRIMGKDTRTRYRTIIAIILESGVLYPAVMIVSVVMQMTLDPEASGALRIDLTPTSFVVAGIAPTLIIVRCAYGKAIKNVDRDRVEMSSLHFAPTPKERTEEQTHTTMVD
ncbi:hypothetical protein PM082_012498 [Marasmius tenuissimus]|nr:hypothetical protein PM082_012498 [Marasmius tenuissimus]